MVFIAPVLLLFDVGVTSLNKWKFNFPGHMFLWTAATCCGCQDAHRHAQGTAQIMHPGDPLVRALAQGRDTAPAFTRGAARPRAIWSVRTCILVQSLVSSTAGENTYRTTLTASNKTYYSCRKAHRIHLQSTCASSGLLNGHRLI